MKRQTKPCVQCDEQIGFFITQNAELVNFFGPEGRPIGTLREINHMGKESEPRCMNCKHPLHPDCLTGQ